MNEKPWSRELAEVIKLFDVMIKLLKKFGVKSDIDRAQAWFFALQRDPSKDDLNILWSEIQHIGSRMNYMDYADEKYIEVVGKIKDQMLNVIILVRKQLPTKKDTG